MSSFAIKHSAKLRRRLVIAYLTFMALVFLLWPLAALWTA